MWGAASANLESTKSSSPCRARRARVGAQRAEGLQRGREGGGAVFGKQRVHGIGTERIRMRAGHGEANAGAVVDQGDGDKRVIDLAGAGAAMVAPGPFGRIEGHAEREH